VFVPSSTCIIEDRVARSGFRSSPDTITIARIAARLPVPRPADVGISHTAAGSRTCIYARLAALVCGIGIREGWSTYSRSRVLTPCSVHVGCCREPRSRILHLIRVSLALTVTVATQVYGLVMDLLASGRSLNLFQLTQMGIPCKDRIGSSRLERFPSGKDFSSRPRIVSSPTQNLVPSGFEGYEIRPVSGVLR
jgi:hypothetical protein